MVSMTAFFLQLLVFYLTVYVFDKENTFDFVGRIFITALAIHKFSILFYYVGAVTNIAFNIWHNNTSLFCPYVFPVFHKALIIFVISYGKHSSVFKQCNCMLIPYGNRNNILPVLYISIICRVIT